MNEGGDAGEHDQEAKRAEGEPTPVEQEKEEFKEEGEEEGEESLFKG